MARKRRSDAAPIGRKRIPLDPKQVEKMAGIGCTDEEIGDVLGASGETIRRRFGEILVKARATMRQRLRQAQYKAALDGDRTMLVWLGKQMLGQQDHQSISITDLQKRTDEELAAIASGKIPA